MRCLERLWPDRGLAFARDLAFFAAAGVPGATIFQLGGLDARYRDVRDRSA